MKPPEQPSLTTQARQGEAKAIALLLHRALHNPAIGLRVESSGHHLHLVFDVPLDYDVQRLDQFVRMGITRLQNPVLQTVQIDAYEANTQRQIWSNTVTFATPQAAPGSATMIQPQSTYYLPPASPPASQSPNAHTPQHPNPRPSERPHPAPAEVSSGSRQPRPRPHLRTQNPCPSQSSPLASSRGATPKAPPQDWGFWLLSRFNWWKVALVLFLASHSIFGSPHYTILGFLTGADPLMGFLHNVNLIFHEAGHVLFMPFGRFLHILGGSLLQILIPAGLCSYFWFTHQRYASAIALWWAGQNFLDVSIYIRDAQERLLPLLGGEAVLHDWHFLLLDLRLLTQSEAIANLAYTTGILLYLIAIPWALYAAQRSESSESTA